VKEHRSFAHQSQSFFEWNSQEAAWLLRLTLTATLRVESNLFLELFPVVIISLQRFIVNVEVATQQVFDLVICEHANPHLKEASFLLQKPLAQLLVSAVRESANKVRNFIVLAELLVLFFSRDRQLILLPCLLLFESAFECEFALARILVNFECEVAFALVCVVPGRIVNFTSFGGLT
jgi:hypothetical protein